MTEQHYTPGQLWREISYEEAMQNKVKGDRRIIDQHGNPQWQRPVPPQACACEGLRTALEEYLGTEPVLIKRLRDALSNHE